MRGEPPGRRVRRELRRHRGLRLRRSRRRQGERRPVRQSRRRRRDGRDERGVLHAGPRGLREGPGRRRPEPQVAVLRVPGGRPRELPRLHLGRLRGEHVRPARAPVVRRRRDGAQGPRLGPRHEREHVERGEARQHAGRGRGDRRLAHKLRLRQRRVVLERRGVAEHRARALDARVPERDRPEPDQQAQRRRLDVLRQGHQQKPSRSRRRATRSP